MTLDIAALCSMYQEIEKNKCWHEYDSEHLPIEGYSCLSVTQTQSYNSSHSVFTIKCCFLFFFSLFSWNFCSCICVLLCIFVFSLIYSYCRCHCVLFAIQACVAKQVSSYLLTVRTDLQLLVTRSLLLCLIICHSLHLAFCFDRCLFSLLPVSSSIYICVQSTS